jgi:hypothetical protein
MINNLGKNREVVKSRNGAKAIIKNTGPDIKRLYQAEIQRIALDLIELER